MNKMDCAAGRRRRPRSPRAPPAGRFRRRTPRRGVVAISALTGAGIDRLLAAIDEALPLDPIVRTTMRLPSGDGATLAMLHEFGRVLSTRYLEEDGEQVEVEVELPESIQRRLNAAK